MSTVSGFVFHWDKATDSCCFSRHSDLNLFRSYCWGTLCASHELPAIAQILGSTFVHSCASMLTTAELCFVLQLWFLSPSQSSECGCGPESRVCMCPESRHQNVYYFLLRMRKGLSKINTRTRFWKTGILSWVCHWYRFSRVPFCKSFYRCLQPTDLCMFVKNKTFLWVIIYSICSWQSQDTKPTRERDASVPPGRPHATPTHPRLPTPRTLLPHAVRRNATRRWCSVQLDKVVEFCVNVSTDAKRFFSDIFVSTKIFATFAVQQTNVKSNPSCEKQNRYCPKRFAFFSWF